jgi:hypothetical protein
VLALVSRTPSVTLLWTIYICSSKPFTSFPTFPKSMSPCYENEACVRHVFVPQVPSIQLSSSIVPTLGTRENQSPSLKNHGLTTSISSSYSPLALSLSISFESVLLPLSLLIYLKPRIPPVITSVIIIVLSHLRKCSVCPSRFIPSQQQLRRPHSLSTYPSM